MIQKLKDLYLKTDLSAHTEIVSPSEGGWRELGVTLQKAIEEATGSAVPLRHADTFDDRVFERRNLVILGSAMNNPAAMALYRHKFAFIDDFYPGKAGFVARTVHNPFGYGRNAVLLGGSRLEGAQSAVERFQEILRRDGPVLGRINLAHSDYHKRVLPKDPPEVFLKRAEEAFIANQGRGAVSGAIVMGQAYHLTEDRRCARIFRDVLYYYIHLVQDVYGGDWCFEHMIFVYSWLWELVYVWDLIEESDFFTDEDRLKLTNALLGLTHYAAKLSYFERETQLEVRQNHWTYAALSMAFAAQYFRKYYKIETFEQQERFARRIFDGQAESYKPDDDAGGGGYCWAVPSHLMYYDLMRGDYRFLENGSLRTLADYALIITDNMGSPCSFGDIGGYARRGPVSPRMFQTLSTAAWYYNDGRYTWAIRWMGGQEGKLACYYKEVPPVKPHHLAGIAIAPFNRSLYEWVEKHARGGANIPISEAFDKLCLRAGFDEQDEYLLLDGISTFAHGHEDGNSILRLTSHGRMWLTETDYIWNYPKHHNSMVVVCDGVSGPMPVLTALKWAEDFGDLVFTRTAVPAYNGTDWTRDTVWRKGRYFLILDSLKLLQDGDYDLQCLWRTLGEVNLTEEGLNVEQQGMAFHIKSADDSVKSLKREPPRIVGQDPYRAYPYAEGDIQILRERKELHGKQGAVEYYFNLMYAGPVEETAHLELSQVGESMVKIEDPDDPALVGIPDGPCHVGGFRLNAGAFALTGDSIALINATAFRYEGISIESTQPATLLLYPGRGKGEIRAKERTGFALKGIEGGGVEVDGARYSERNGVIHFTLQVGTYPVTFAPYYDIRPLRETVAFTRKYAPPAPSPKRHLVSPTEVSPLQPLWNSSHQGAIRAASTHKTERDTRIGLGTEEGAVTQLLSDGRILWDRKFDREIRTVHLSDVDEDGEAEMIVGGRDCKLVLLGSKGEVRWEHAFGPSHGRDQIVNAAATADLNGDGKREIVAVTDGWLVFAFSPDGDLLWKSDVYGHAAQNCLICDVEGDGKLEIVVGTEYYTSDMFEADGTLRWLTRGGPGFTVLGAADLGGGGPGCTVLGAADLDRCGVKEVLFGSMDGNLYAVDGRTGETKWTCNLGGEVQHGAISDIVGDGRIEIAAGSERGDVCLVSNIGEKLWRRDLGNSVTGLAVADLNGDRRPEIIAGTCEGKIALLTPDGAVLGTHDMGSEITFLGTITDPHDPPLLLVGTAHGNLDALVWKYVDH